MDYKVRASRAKALTQNEHFQTIMQDLRDRQLEIFADSRADEMDKREDAHAILRALNQLEYILQADINAEKLIDRKGSAPHGD
jgi:uncharacterized membrane protein YheB (UPF0754 family)